MSAIKPIGSCMQTDSEGFLIGIAGPEKITAPWDAPVEEIRDAYISHLGSRLHSVYVRGSVAKGTAIEGVSDIDTLGVVHDSVAEIDDGWTASFSSRMRSKYPFQAGIEIVFPELEQLLHAPERVGGRFTIKTQSACIYGENLADSMQRFRPGHELIMHAFRIEAEMRGVCKDLEEDTDESQLRNVCQWLMKRIVRTGLELVMEREQTYTRDLYPCFDRFSSHYPAQRSNMEQALCWAIEPTSDRQVIAAFVARFGPWLTREVDGCFGPDRAE